MVERKKSKKNRMGRPESKAVRFSDLVVGKLYKHFVTGQVFRIVAIDYAQSALQYKAETEYTGRGRAMAARLGEVREVLNAHQWVGRLIEYVPAAE